MRIPIAPVRNKTRLGILAGKKILSSLGLDQIPFVVTRNFGEKFKVSESAIAWVESIVPIATWLYRIITINVVSTHPANKGLCSLKILIVIPLLGSHNEGKGSVYIGISSRSSVTIFTYAPVHTTISTHRVVFPSSPKLVEFGLMIALRARHIHHNHHTISNCFGHCRLRSFWGKNPCFRTLVLIPCSFPFSKMILDHLRVGIFNGIAVWVCPVLRKWILWSGHR